MTSYRILILDTYYPAFLRSFYSKHGGLEGQAYREQWWALMDQCFATADFYSFNLKKLGHESEEVIANCEPLQREWARENGLSVERRWPMLTFRRKYGLPVPVFRRDDKWLFNVLLAQVEAYKPDVLYVQNIAWLPQNVLRQAKEHARLVVGQHATTLPQQEVCCGYDLILSSLPNVVAHFRRIGVRSEFLALGFEASVLERLNGDGLKQVVHVGGYGPIHDERNQLLEQVAQKVYVDFWGYGVRNLALDSPIRQRYRGEAWGLDMYNIRHSSRITLTKHITSVAGRYANNATLFEATGVGTCLVTDMKNNLHELFEPDREVAAYTCAEDCIEKVRYLLEHEDERAAIAKAGQERTLREHTYYQRMQELVDIVERHLSRPERAARVVSVPG